MASDPKEFYNLPVMSHFLYPGYDQSTYHPPYNESMAAAVQSNSYQPCNNESSMEGQSSYQQPPCNNSIDNNQYDDCSLDAENNVADFLMGDEHAKDGHKDDQSGDKGKPGPDIKEPQWYICNGRQHHFEYNSTSHGVRKSYGSKVTPAEIFLDIVDIEVLTYIVNETNKSNAKLKDWEPTNVEEILKFFGLLLWMGLDRRDDFSSYWSPKPIYRNDVAPACMTRPRFLDLARNIHFSDTSVNPGGNRIEYIEPFINLITRKYQELYTPEENIVIDETFQLWEGGSASRECNPTNAQRYGIRTFKLRSSSGYVWSMKACAGKAFSSGRGIGQVDIICRELLEGLLNENRTLYIDNFGASYHLAKFLVAHRTHCVGMLRPYKYVLPNVLLQAQLAVGEAISREDPQGIMIMKWKDSREIWLISTKHGPKMVDVQPQVRAESPSKGEVGSPSHLNPDSSNQINSHPTTQAHFHANNQLNSLLNNQAHALASHQAIPLTTNQAIPLTTNPAHPHNPAHPGCPPNSQPETSSKEEAKVAHIRSKPLAYISYMKGRSVSAIANYYTCAATATRKGMKWSRKLAFDVLFGISVANAFLIYQSVCTKKCAIRQFKEELIESLLNIRQPTKSQRYMTSLPRIEGRHTLREVRTKVPSSRKRCKRCYATVAKNEGPKVAAKKAKKVYTYCAQCPDKPYFCLECFGEFHTK